MARAWPVSRWYLRGMVLDVPRADPLRTMDWEVLLLVLVGLWLLATGLVPRWYRR